MNKNKFRLNTLTILALILSLMVFGTACQNTQKTQEGKESTDSTKNTDSKPDTAPKQKFKIGISQIIEHNALDQARLGFMDELKSTADVEFEFIEKNAQGQPQNALTIANNFVDEKMDLIYAISTPSAQAAKQAAENKIPIIFSAVSDPVKSDLVASLENSGSNITGISDLAPMDKQFQLFQQIDPNIKTIGIIYSTSEDNSQIQINQANEIAKKLGLKLELVGVSAVSEISPGMDVLLSNCDAVYMLTDNLISSASELVTSKALAAKKFIVCAEENLLSAGSLITNSVNYYDMGKECAVIAKQILVDKKEASSIPSKYPSNLRVSFNEKVATEFEFDLDKEPFKSAHKYGE